MAPVKIVFGDHCATPPVFVAGSFTEWKPVEIEVQNSGEGNVYEKTFDLAPGTYQYKFRLGPGDWWVCDSQAPLTRDAAGNENNELVVSAESTPVPPTTVATAAVDEAPVLEQSTVPEPAKKVTSRGYYQQALEEKPVSKPDDTPSLSISPNKAVEKETEEKPVGGANGIATEPLRPSQQVNTSEPAEAESNKVVQESEKSVAPESTTRQSESKDTSITSLPSKEKVSSKQHDKPVKLSWFSRIFLCGSSRQTMLAAIVVVTSIFAAYIIQR